MNMKVVYHQTLLPSASLSKASNCGSTEFTASSYNTKMWVTSVSRMISDSESSECAGMKHTSWHFQRRERPRQ